MWVRFLLSLIFVTYLTKTSLSNPSLSYTHSRILERKKVPRGSSKLNLKRLVRSLITSHARKKLLPLKNRLIDSKLRRHHYCSSKRTRLTETFFKFVKTPLTWTSHKIPYPKFLVSQLKTSSNYSTGLRSHILVLRHKFALYETYKDLVLLRYEPVLPNLKLALKHSPSRSVSLHPNLNVPSQINTPEALERPVDSLLLGYFTNYISNTFTYFDSHLPGFTFSKHLHRYKQPHVDYLNLSRLIKSFKNELSFRYTIKWFNIQRRKDFRRYYTFYSHYEDTVRDQRSYRRVMLPKFKDSRRGSLWDLPAESTYAGSTLTPSVKNSSKTDLKSNLHSALSLRPGLRSLRTTSIKSHHRNLSKPKTIKWHTTPRKLVRLKVKRFRRFRRSLRWFSKRFHGLYGYLRRSSKRCKRKLKRFVYRFTRLRKRRLKRPSLKISRSFFRRRYFRILRRRIKRLLRRRFKLPTVLKKRSKQRRLSHTVHTLRRVIRFSRRRHILLNRPSLYKFAANLTSFFPNITARDSLDTFSLVSNRAPQSKGTKTYNPGSVNVSSVFLLLNNPKLIGLSPYKYLLTNQTSVKQTSYYQFKNLVTHVQQQVYSYSKALTSCRLDNSNLWSLNQTGYSIRRKFLRLIASSSFSADLSFWYYKTLIQFIENCSGKRTNLYFGPFIENALTFEDRARCTLWNNRVTGFQRIMGHRIFVYEALAIVAVAIRLKDPTFLANWIRGMLKRLSFWRYRLIFRYLKFLLRYIFQPNFHLFDFRGVKLSLKGKISVAGNARTRTLFMRFGDTSHSKMDNKVSYDLSLVNTFTGVLGFKLLFYY